MRPVTEPDDISLGGSPRRIGFMGNCQTELLQRAFSRIAPGGQFRSFYHFTELTEAERPQAKAELDACDILLIQDIKNFDDYPLRDQIPAKTRQIRFPFLWFAAPWPYDDFNGLRDTHARSQDDPSLHTVIYYDGALGRLRKLVPDPQARLEAYRVLDVPGLVSPQRVLDFEARRLEAQDQRFGIGIGRFILENFRTKPLFHTVNRPCGPLLAMLLTHLLSELQIALPLPPLPELDELAAIQAPIHPKVAEALGMGWVKPDRLYQVDGERRDWEAHARAYIARYS
jgi:hypothetical protein